MAGGPFVYVDAINEKKKVEIKSDYDQFLINRHFSLFLDTILIAAEASRMNVSNELHFAYYLDAVSKRKRFRKWPKSKESERVKMVAEYFECTYERAVDNIWCLSEEQLEEISKWFKDKKEQE